MRAGSFVHATGRQNDLVVNIYTGLAELKMNGPFREIVAGGYGLAFAGSVLRSWKTVTRKILDHRVLQTACTTLRKQSV